MLALDDLLAFLVAMVRAVVPVLVAHHPLPPGRRLLRRLVDRVNDRQATTARGPRDPPKQPVVQILKLGYRRLLPRILPVLATVNPGTVQDQGALDRVATGGMAVGAPAAFGMQSTGQ